MNNSNLIFVRYLGPTNTLGSRIELSTYDVSRYENRDKKKKIVLGYDYALDSYKQSQAVIESAGLKILGRNDRHPDFIVYMVQWDYDSMCKLFKIKSEV